MNSSVLPTYKRAPLAFDHGKGMRLYTEDGREYLDFGAGVAVTSLGHAHPHLVKATMTLMMKRLPLALAAAALLGACATPPASNAPASTAAASGAAAFDGGVRPQDDLFRAANGRWLETTPIPADKASYGTTAVLRDQADARVRAIVDELATREPRDAGERQLRDYYLSQLDTAAIDRAGMAPAAPWLARIDGLKNHEQLAMLFGELQGMASLPARVNTT